MKVHEDKIKQAYRLTADNRFENAVIIAILDSARVSDELYNSHGCKVTKRGTFNFCYIPFSSARNYNITGVPSLTILK